MSAYLRIGLLAGLAIGSAGLVIVACSTFNEGPGATSNVDSGILSDAPVGDSPATTFPDAASADAGLIDTGVIDPIATYVAAVMQDQPIAYWRLEETDGGLARDEMGSYDLTPQPGILDAGGVLGNGAELTGIGSFLYKFDTGRLRFIGRNAMTVEAWVRRKTPGDQDRTLMSVFTPGAGGNSMGWQVTVDNKLHFTRAGDGGVTTTSASDAVDQVNLWHHVVVVYDGLTQTVYVDGILGSASTPDTTTIPDFSQTFYLGGDTSANPFIGFVDEVAIYDKVLPEDRVQAHYDTVTKR